VVQDVPGVKAPRKELFRKLKKDNLLGIVIIQGDCYTQLNQQQVEEIRQKLMSKLHSAFKGTLRRRLSHMFFVLV